MSTKGGHRSKNKKPLQTTLGKAAVSNNNEEIDYSHVRAPIHTSVFGLRHALSLFDTATDEVKRYITYECDIMYECRICRTIYRSLANFVLHKRNYCQQKFTAVITDENNYEENDVDIACVNEVTSRANNGTDENHQTNESPKSRKNLNSVLEKLNDKQECLKLTEEILNDGNPDREQATVEKIQDNKIALEPIANSSVGVFQSFNKPAQELMKTEAMEIHSMLNTNEAILGPDGTVISIQMENRAANVPKPKLTCAICNLKFSTKKTLTYHIKYKHNNTRVVYICPECKDSFANAWCVFRHLYKVHRKTTTQVRKLRDQIHSSAIIKKQETEVKKKDKPDEVETINNENQWMIDFEGDNDLQMCGGCGKRFERRAALNSHSQLCMKRLAVCNTIKENSKRNQIDEKVNKPKGCDPPVLRGSKKRKPNILRKTRRDIYVENETIEENSVTNENKLPETISNQDPVIELKESPLMMNVEPAVDDMRTRDEITVTPQDGSEMKDSSEKTKDDAYKRTAIEEIIFGSREDGEECNESKEDVPIISDDEDVLGFPPASNKLELKVPDKPNEELVESNINNIECTIKNLFNEKIYNKVADEVIEKTKEIISQIIVENRDVISTECLDNFHEVINKDCVGNVGEVEKDMISEECADNINKQPDNPEIKYDHTSDEQIGIHEEEINKLQFHEVTSINESNQIISEDTRGAIGENFNVNVPKDVESVGSSTENKSISVNFEDLNIISDNEVSDANSECKNVCISKKRKLIELTNSVSNDHVYSTHTDVSGNVINTKEIELTRSSTETLENNSSNVEDLQKNVQAVCDTRSGSKEDVCVSTKRKIIELIQSISNDHLYTPRNDNERGWKKPNILRKPKPIVKQPKLNLSKAGAGICESKISNDLVAVEGEHAVFEFPVRLSIEHLTRMQNMTVLPTIPISIASVESDDDKFPRLVSLSTDNETNIQNLSITSTSPTGNINNFTNKEIQDLGFDAQETVYELNIQNVMSTKDNVENKYDDLSAVINEYRSNDSEHLDQKEINDKVEQKNIYSLYNNHDIENRENDVQTKEDINDNVEYINDNFKLHCDRELRYKSKKQGQKRRHSMSTEQDVTEISLELKSRKYIDSDKLVCVPCKFTFSSKKYLMRHMSLHFNWFRYQCSKCAFMSYEKLTCHQHSKTHNVSELLIRNIVMPIPNWKTVSLSRNFTNIIDRKCNDESNQSAVEDMKEDPPQDDDIECIDIQKINKQDPMLRKMIMEVIFGSDLTPANAEEKPIINSDTRPVRSRPVVPNFQKDFVYDMKQVDTEMETKKSSFQAKVKPFKIVKSTDANFKVVHINDPTGKKKKPNTEKEPS